MEKNDKSPKQPRILIVDDDESICTTLGLILEARGYTVDIAHTGKEAIEKSNTNTYNVAILDIRLPDLEGTALLKEMRPTIPRTVKIMLTGYPHLENAITSLNDGADAYFTKPMDPAKILKKIEEKLLEQTESETKTTEQLGAFLTNRSEKYLQNLKQEH